MIISASKLDKLRRLQKETQKKTNKKGEILGIYNLAEAVVELDSLMLQITKTKRKQISDAAAPIAVAAYKNMVPKSSKSHKFYQKGLKYIIEPGNLQRSVQLVSTVKNWQGITTAIGPLYKNQGKNVTLNSDSKTDGFYAHMIYGSTKAWISKVRNKAEKASQMAVINKMSQEALKVAKEYPRKFWEL